MTHHLPTADAVGVPGRPCVVLESFEGRLGEGFCKRWQRAQRSSIIPAANIATVAAALERCSGSKVCLPQGPWDKMANQYLLLSSVRHAGVMISIIRDFLQEGSNASVQAPGSLHPVEDGGSFLRRQADRPGLCAFRIQMKSVGVLQLLSLYGTAGSAATKRFSVRRT